MEHYRKAEQRAREQVRQAKQYADHVRRHCPGCPAKIAHYERAAERAMAEWITASEMLGFAELSLERVEAA